MTFASTTKRSRVDTTTPPGATVTANNHFVAGSSD